MKSRLRVPVLALVIAAMFLPISVALAGIHYAGEKKDVRHTLQREVDAQVAALSAYFKRARSIVLLLSNNPAFERFYGPPGSFEEKLRAQGPAIQEANAALGYLESLYPNSIGEACFIDERGAEIARVVRGHVATIKQLSPDESGASFFAPTFASEVGDVYQAQPYVSPDTGEWVIANATLVPMEDRARSAIVHFEVTWRASGRKRQGAPA